MCLSILLSFVLTYLIQSHADSLFSPTGEFFIVKRYVILYDNTSSLNIKPYKICTEYLENSTVERLVEREYILRLAFTGTMLVITK